mmetsp:Transcript_33417/g.40471  ORF Transcript_33417/g.40471 Transcript_33417/m.40471 type:complete len:468 (-) Transcript_33417:171-1574(-)
MFPDSESSQAKSEENLNSTYNSVVGNDIVICCGRVFSKRLIIPMNIFFLLCIIGICVGVIFGVGSDNVSDPRGVPDDMKDSEDPIVNPTFSPTSSINSITKTNSPIAATSAPTSAVTTSTIIPTNPPLLDGTNAPSVKQTLMPSISCVPIAPIVLPSITQGLFPKSLPVNITWEVSNETRTVPPFPDPNQSYSDDKIWMVKSDKYADIVTVKKSSSNNIFQEIKCPENACGDNLHWFGRVVKISADGNTLVVGAGLDSSDSENTEKTDELWSIFIYGRKCVNGNFLIEQVINSVNIEEINLNANFGVSIDLSSNGNSLVIGAEKAFDSGVVFIYTKNATEGGFMLEQRLNGEVEYGNFGSSVAISSFGNTIVASAGGTSFEESFSGSTYIFVSDLDNKWREDSRFDGDRFGINLGHFGVIIEDTTSSLFVHAKDDQDVVRTFQTHCNCNTTELKCGSFETYPFVYCN